MLTVRVVKEAAPEYLGGGDQNLVLNENLQELVVYLDPAKYPATVAGRLDRVNRLQQLGRYLRNSAFSEFALSGTCVKGTVAVAQGFYDGNLEKNTEKTLHVEEAVRADFERVNGHLNFLRNLINRPAHDVTPEKLAQEAAAHLVDTVAAAGLPAQAITTNIVYNDELLAQELVGIHTVGRGSANKPAFLEVDFNPSQNVEEPVVLALVGKGITFDTGGYDIKPSDGMITMRSDMGGAALMTASLALAISLGLAKRVKLFLCCAENMISSTAMRPSDIIKYPNGVSASVDNTDAEGRLVLADGLIRASKANNGARPKYIMDAATLTGAAKIAVGTDYHSVLSFDDEMVAALFDQAQESRERFWRLPFEEMHRSYIKSSSATISNTGAMVQAPGASTAAAFLSYFVEDYKQGWIHIDASATYNRRGGVELSLGATGRGAQTLAQFFLTLE